MSLHIPTITYKAYWVVAALDLGHVMDGWREIDLLVGLLSGIHLLQPYALHLKLQQQCNFPGHQQAKTPVTPMKGGCRRNS